MKAVRRLLRYGAWGFVGVLALAMGAVGVFTLTERGRANLAGLVSTSISSDDMKIAVSGVDGLWSGRLRASEIVVADREGPWLAIRDAEVDWSPLALLGFAFEAERVRAGRIEVARLPVASEQPSSGGFSLPVTVDIAAIDLPAVLLGRGVAGQGASLAAEGSLRIAGEPISVETRLQVERTDGARGSLSVDAAYLPGENRITLDVEGAEPAGGIVAALLRLPGNPAVAIRASGTGPASDWAGKAEFEVDGTVVTRLSGRHQLTDGGNRIEVDGQGAFASFLPASLAPLAAGDTAIEFLGTVGAGGRLSVDTARLASQAVEATASGTVDPAGESDFRLAVATSEATPRLTFGSGAAALTVALGSADLAMKGPAGALALDGTATLPLVSLPDHDAEDVTATFTSRDLNLAALTGTIGIDARAEAAGSANAIVAGLLAGGLSADIVVRLDGSRVAFETRSMRTGTAQVAATGAYTVADGSLSADVSAQARSVVLPAAARGLLGETLALSARIVRGSDGAIAVTGIDAQSGPLTASGEARLAGTDLTASLQGGFAELSRLSAQADGSATFNLSASGPVARPSVELTAGSTRMTVAGRAISDLSLQASLVADPAAPSGSFKLGGSVGDEQLTGGGQLVASAGGGAELRGFSLSLGGNSVEGALTLDRALVPAGTVTFNLPDLAPLAALALTEAQGAARGSLRFDSGGGKPQLTLDALVDHLTVASAQAGEVRLNATVSDYLANPVVAGGASAGRLIAGGAELRELSVTLSQEDGWTRFDGRLAANGIPVTAAGRVRYAGGVATVELDSATASPRGMAASLAVPTRLVWSDGALRLDGFTVAAAGGRATASGTLGTALSLDIRLASLPAAALNPFAPGLDAAGTISGTARVTGSASAPVVTFEANVAGGSVAQTREAGFGAINIAATGSYAGTAIRFDGRIDEGTGLGMQGGGTLDIAARSAVLDFSGRVPFAFLTRRLAAQGVALSGAADVSIAVRGNLFSPDLSGNIRASGARFVHAASGIAVEDLAADISLGGGQASIASLTGRLSTGGAISGSGTVGITPASGFPADITVSVADGRYTDGRIVTASFNGQIAVTGQLADSPLLAGTVNLGRTVVTVPDRIAGSVAGLDVQHRNAPAAVTRQEEALRPASGGGSGAGGLTLDLNVSAPQQIFVVGRGLDVELGGSLRLTGPLDAPQAVGRFELQRGRLSLLGRRLDFTNGSVGFSGSLVPYLDLDASTQAEGATVTISVTGPATDPTFSFGSSPSLPEDEVMARLLFGRAMSGLSPVQIAQLASAAAQLAGIGGSTSFLERLREQVGVDDIDVRTDDKTGDTSLSVGKYLNDRTYLRLEKGIQPGSGRATIDLNVGGGVKLRGEATDGGEARGGIFFEREY
jgi:translocation and assembly module TamB